MALAHELNILDQGHILSDESKGLTHGELIRDYEPMEDVKWRFGKPNYAKVNTFYFEHRSSKPAEGSLVAIVNKLVKNWEVESHHIADPHQYKTMDISKFVSMNNGACPASAYYMAEVGPYNMLIGETKDYSSKLSTFEKANQNFSRSLPDGFAFEVTDVYSGPPTVAFKWRHFGMMTGTFTDKFGNEYEGNGEMLNLHGLCIAVVNADLIIESLDVYYNPEDMLGPLMKAGVKCPVSASQKTKITENKAKVFPEPLGEKSSASDDEELKGNCSVM